MCRLAENHRPENTIVKAGACSGNDMTLKYYMHPVSTYRGHNTFDEAVASRNGFADNYVEVPVMNINRILDRYCDKTPDVLDIDTEGMDFELLEALDTDRFRIKLICGEKCVGKKEYDALMGEKGYVHFMETQENVIYIAGDCLAQLSKS